jgi:hypothetical protein
VNVTPIEERRRKIASKITPDTERRKFRHFSRPLDLPVILMSIDDLVYRMRNGRTRTEQAKWVKENKKPRDFFSAGQDNLSVQRVQHDLLLKFANGEKGRVLLDVLKKDQEQTDPLLITREGVVLNGNRRLALMRHLREQDRLDNTNLYSAFATVECQVLDPGIGEPEMREIETRLQAARETKLGYDWIDEILLARDLRDDGKTAGQIADLMNMKEADLNVLFQRLEEAELYVREYLREPDEEGETLAPLRDIVGAEQQFIELQKALADLPAEQHDNARAIQHVLTANPAPSGQGRKYDYRYAYQQEHISTVMERLAKRAGIDLTMADKPKPVDDDPFADDQGDDVAISFAPVKAWLNNRENADEKATMIRDVTREIREEQDDQQRETRALRQVTEMLSDLQSIDLRSAAPATIDPISDKLQQIQSEVTSLLGRLKVIQARG